MIHKDTAKTMKNLKHRHEQLGERSRLQLVLMMSRVGRRNRGKVWLEVYSVRKNSLEPRLRKGFQTIPDYFRLRFVNHLESHA